MRYLIAAAVLIGALTLLIMGLSKWEAAIEKRGYNKAVAEYNEKAVIAEKAQRAEEVRRNAEQRKALDEHTKQVDAARLDADAAKRTVTSLRNTLAKLRSQRPASTDTATAAASVAADSVGELFSVCTERYSGMAIHADQARNAGLLCQKLYSANIPTVRDQVEVMRKEKLP